MAIHQTNFSRSRFHDEFSHNLKRLLDDRELQN
jgi:hypothetical protein